MITLYNHQKLALAYLRLNRSFALFMEQGTGKTIPCLKRMLELFQSKQAENALVVAPKAVIGSWWRDVEKFDSNEQIVLRSKMTVVSYDLIWRREEYRKHWSIIILDESHKIEARCKHNLRGNA